MRERSVDGFLIGLFSPITRPAFALCLGNVWTGLKESLSFSLKVCGTSRGKYGTDKCGNIPTLVTFNGF